MIKLKQFEDCAWTATIDFQFDHTSRVVHRWLIIHGWEFIFCIITAAYRTCFWAYASWRLVMEVKESTLVIPFCQLDCRCSMAMLYLQFGKGLNRAGSETFFFLFLPNDQCMEKALSFAAPLIFALPIFLLCLYKFGYFKVNINLVLSSL